MAYEELIQLVGNVGFPIAISIYLLITRDKVIKENSSALQNLKESIDALLQNFKK